MNILNSDDLTSLNSFNLHNKKLFRKNESKREKFFLIEFNGWQAIHIIFSYLVNYFKNERNCNIIAYECYDLLNRLDPPWYKKYLWKIGSIFYLKTFKIFKFFGTDKFIKPIYNKEIDLKAEKITTNFLKKKPVLKDLENFKINNVWIGDLIYDSYLKKYSLATIDIKSNNFIKFFNDSIRLNLFWENFFNKNKVEAICGCHSVYLTGIPLRIANSKNINCFYITPVNLGLVNLTDSISYKNKINGSDIQFKYYKQTFNKLPKKLKQLYKIEGKKIINDFISGKTKHYYLKKSLYKKKITKITKPKKSRIKVVIFMHDILDSPHVYGNHFFPDFKEWFNFLNNIIQKTDYDWYVKEHPSSSNETKKEINKLIYRNKQLKKINKSIPNNNLVKIGIKFVLTVYGSVSAELPIYGINVINASKNNPHFNYKFCINPQNLNEYKNILLNLKKFKHKIKLDDLYLYHFMKYLVFKSNLFFKNPNNYLKFYYGKPLQFTNKIYEKWLKDFNIDKHNYIVKNLKKFIKSKNYFFIDYKI